MAPRARGRKDTRMDAAIDVTREMGFDEKLVRSTVNDLLKVYKGNNRTLNPWRFIEGGLLSLLNEQLLEKVQGQDAAENRDADPQDDNASQDDAPMQEGAAPLEDAALLEDVAPIDDAAPLDNASAAAPSSTAILSTCDNAPQDDGSAAGTSRTAILRTCSEAVDSTFLTEDLGDSASHTNEPGLTSLIKMPDRFASRRSRPYYGWMTSDDEEDPVVMASFPLSEMVKLLIRPDKKRKRKSRWDM